MYGSAAPVADASGAALFSVFIVRHARKRACRAVLPDDARPLVA